MRKSEFKIPLVPSDDILEDHIDPVEFLPENVKPKRKLGVAAYKGSFSTLDQIMDRPHCTDKY